MKNPSRACGSESGWPETAGLSSDFQVFRIRNDVLDRFPSNVLQCVFQVTIRIEAVDDGRADYREQPGGVVLPCHKTKSPLACGGSMEEDGLWQQGVNQRRLPEPSGSVVRPDPMRNLITLTKFLSNRIH